MLKIALDIDDTLVDFLGSYYKKFGIPKKDCEITKNVEKLKYDKEFWENLPKIDDIDFIPELYCTKRINSKTYTKNSLVKNNFPLKPIYQVLYQKANKANYIKGRCDVLIDDSVSNVLACHQKGLPALLIDRPHNAWFGPQFRIYSLSYNEIEEAYNLLLEFGFK